MPWPVPSLWHNPYFLAERDRQQLEALRVLAARALTWRTGLYWIRLTDPPEDSGQPVNAMWAQCHRCGVRESVSLPADLGDVTSRLREIAATHARCPQTLAGARWELLVTLRLRAAQTPGAL